MIRAELFKKTFRDNRHALFWWSLGLAALSFYIMYFYPFISRASEFLEVMEKLPPMIRNLIGDTVQLTTPEGFFNVQPFSMMAPLVFLIFAIAKALDTVCGENDRGTLDLLLAQPLSRVRVLAEKFTAICLLMVAMAVVFWFGMAAGSMIFSIPLNKIRLLEAIVACLALAVFYAALTLALSVFTLKRKTSAGIVSGLAIVTYLVNAYAPMVPALRTYRYFSPFYYYIGSAPLVNGLHPGHLLTLLAAALVFFLLATWRFHHRDILH